MYLFSIPCSNSPIDISDLVKADWGIIKGFSLQIFLWWIAPNNTHEKEGMRGGHVKPIKQPPPPEYTTTEVAACALSLAWKYPLFFWYHHSASPLQINLSVQVVHVVQVGTDFRSLLLARVVGPKPHSFHSCLCDWIRPRSKPMSDMEVLARTTKQEAASWCWSFTKLTDAHVIVLGAGLARPAWELNPQRGSRDER